MNRPPGPRTPAFLQRLQWILDPFPLLDRYAQRYRMQTEVQIPEISNAI